MRYAPLQFPFLADMERFMCKVQEKQIKDQQSGLSIVIQDSLKYLAHAKESNFSMPWTALDLSTPDLVRISNPFVVTKSKYNERCVTPSD